MRVSVKIKKNIKRRNMIIVMIKAHVFLFKLQLFHALLQKI